MIQAMNAYKFNRKVAVMMGTSRGMLRQVGILMASKGISLAIFDKDGAAGEELISLLQGCGHLLFMGEMKSRNDLASFAHFIQLQYGRVDYMVNSAASGRELVEVDEGGDDVLKVPQEAARSFLARMLKEQFTNGASIINLGEVRSAVSCWETPHKGNYRENPYVFSQKSGISLSVRISHVIPVGRPDCGGVLDEKTAQTIMALCLSLHRSSEVRETIVVDASLPYAFEYYGRGLVNVQSAEADVDYLAVQ
ncbi:SDR family oxidoreductase [Akkermansia sp. N21169]|nr:SDR family oxidoreductase [Akkermansia sp. N21169]